MPIKLIRNLETLGKKHLLIVGRSSLVKLKGGYYANPNEGRYIEDLSMYFTKMTLCVNVFKTPDNFASKSFKLNDKKFEIIELPITLHAGITHKLWQYAVRFWRIGVASSSADMIFFFSTGFLGLYTWMISVIRKVPSISYIGGDWCVYTKIQIEKYRKNIILWPIFILYSKIVCFLEDYSRRRVNIRLIRGEELYVRYQKCHIGFSYRMLPMTNISWHDIRKEETVPTKLHKPARLLFVGRLETENGTDDLLNAIELLIRSYSQQVELWIAGEGSLLSSIQNQIHRNSLPINLLGYIENGKPLIDVYRACDILVIPALRAGLPRVIIEGMSQGLPIIATDVGGISKIIQNNLNGLLYKPGDFKELAHSILRMLEDSYFRKSCSNIGVKNAYKLIKKESAGEITAKVISNHIHAIHKNLEE